MSEQYELLRLSVFRAARAKWSKWSAFVRARCFRCEDSRGAATGSQYCDCDASLSVERSLLELYDKCSIIVVSNLEALSQA